MSRSTVAVHAGETIYEADNFTVIDVDGFPMAFFKKDSLEVLCGPLHLPCYHWNRMLLSSSM